LFNGWALPAFQNYVAAWFLTVLVFGLGGAIIYTMIFNRKTRQGIHDLLLDTYVVHLPGKPIESFPISSRIHLAVISIWIGFVAVGTLASALIAPSLVSRTPFGPVLSLYNILKDDPRFFTVGVNDHTFFGSNGRTSRSLIVTVWYKGRLEQNQIKEVVNSVAKVVLENAQDLNQYDGLQIKITFAYDIGIASGNIFVSFANSLEDWRKEINLNSSPNGFVPSLSEFVVSVP
jgi:hypothetical protein